jgi:hypothetical protein
MKAPIAVGIFLLVAVSTVRAENFVEVVDGSGKPIKNHRVDVDSIRKDADGFVYFTENTPMGRSDSALNCENRTWKYDGSKVVPGNYGAALAEFVCSRAT